MNALTQVLHGNAHEIQAFDVVMVAHENSKVCSRECSGKYAQKGFVVVP